MTVADICTSELCEIALTHLMPIVACFPLLFIVYSPFASVRAMEATKTSGSFNTLIFPAMQCVGLSVALYGIFLKNYYLFFPNLVTFLAATYYCISSIRYAPPNKQHIMITSVLAGFATILFVTLLSFVSFSGQGSTSQELLGVLSCLAIIILNLAPFATINVILKTRDSSSICRGFAFGLSLAGLIWTTYGIILSDSFVIVANASSLASGLIQLALTVIFRSKPVIIDEKNSNPSEFKTEFVKEVVIQASEISQEFQDKPHDTVCVINDTDIRKPEIEQEEIEKEIVSTKRHGYLPTVRVMDEVIVQIPAETIKSPSVPILESMYSKHPTMMI